MSVIKWALQLVVTLLSSVILVIVAINLFVVLSAKFKMYTPQQLADTDYKSDYVPVLVLGAGIIDNRYPSSVLKGRLDTALQIYEELPHKKFIMSGDHREDNYNEVQVMKDYLIDHGVPSDQIYLDHAGYSTYESLYRLKYVFKQDKVIIVTQGYHLSRAMMAARRLGVDAVGVPAEEVASTRMKRELREIAARIKDFAVLYLGYKEVTPVEDYPFDLSKPGDDTNDKEALSR